MTQRQFKTLAALSLTTGLIVFALPALALGPLVPSCALTVERTPPDLQCVIQAFRNVAQLVFALTGSAALFMFVWGGFTWITSQGSSDGVKKGKTIIMNAVIGIILIFTSGYVVDYLMKRLQAGARTHSVGELCNDGLGRYALVNDLMVCQTSCSAMSAQGYSCTDPKAGSDCDTSFAGCGGNTQCCKVAKPR